MRVQQYQIAGLGHLSTLIVDDATGAAAVVDPRRDVDVYLEAAERDDLRIEQVIETHLHNDYVSGGRELAALTGATHVIGAGAELRYDARGVRGGDTIEVGGLRLTVLDTPGHTPESVSYTLADTTRADEPLLMLTGGSLLVGAVGRTDLLGAEARARLLGGDVPLPARRDPAPRGFGGHLPDPRRRIAVLDRDRLHHAGRRSATSDATTRCSRRWRSTPSPAPCSTASPRSRATSPGCDRSTRPARACSAASSRSSRWVSVDVGRGDRRPLAGSSSTPAGPTRTPPVISRAPSRSRSAARSGRGSAGSRTTIGRSCSSWTTRPTSTSCSGRPTASATSRSSARWTAASTPGGPPAGRSSGRRSITADGPRRPGSARNRRTARSSSMSASPPSTTPATSRRRSTSAPGPSPTGSTSCRATGRSP